MRILRAGSLVVISLVLLAGTTKVALADPHAVFYTAVGQQQLFFNVLAALDQADYVEPADGPYSYSRETLLNRRAEQGFGREENTTVNSTKSDLSSILTRNITLEGNDLWTAYLSVQFARESSRRNALDELVRLYCMRSFGRIGCSDDPLEQNPDIAFVSDPIQWKGEVFEEGVLGAALSGTREDQSIRRQRLEDRDKPFVRQQPRAYSRFIASLRKIVESETDPLIKQIKSEKLQTLITESLGQYSYLPVDPHVFDDITYSEQTLDDGTKVYNPTIAYSYYDDGDPGTETVKADEYIGRLMSATIGLDQLKIAVSQELERGAEFIKTIQSFQTADGALADVTIKPTYVSTCYDGVDSDGDGFVDELDNDCHYDGDNNNPYSFDRTRSENGLPNNSSEIADLGVEIISPAHAKLALTQALADTFGDADQNLIYAPANAEQFPGDTTLVGPKGSPTPLPSPGVSGATTLPQSVSFNTTGSPAVAGITDIYDYYARPDKDPLTPEVNPKAPHQEEAGIDALNALTGDTYYLNYEDCGFCGFLDDLLETPYWQEILEDIIKENES